MGTDETDRESGIKKERKGAELSSEEAKPVSRRRSIRKQTEKAGSGQKPRGQL